MRKRIAALAVVAPWLAACGATMRTTTLTRMDQVQSSLGSASTTMRVAPVVTLAASRRSDAPSVELAPQVTTGSTTATRVRVRASAAGRGAWHPSLAVSAEDGVSRTAELAADSLVPLPDVPSLHLRQWRATAGVRVLQGRRQQLGVTLDASQSAGVGAASQAMPQLAAMSVEGRMARILSRNATLNATLRASSERVGTAGALTIARLSSALQWNAAKDLRLSAVGGVVALASGTEPIVEVGAAYGRLASAVRVSALVGRSPEVDRLSGVLTPRLRGRVRFETPLVPRVSFGGTLQHAADQGVETQRVVRSGDAGFAIAVSRSQTVHIGVARFQQYTNGISTNTETRVSMQFTIVAGR